MSRSLSWKWLCSPLTVRKSGSRGRSRPCLAALEQLEDRVLLSAAPAASLSGESLQAVDAFLKIENAYNKAQTEFLKIENKLANDTTQKLSSDTVNYFLKIDSDLVQVDTDLIGSPNTTATGGIDGILDTLKLPSRTADYLDHKLVPAVSQELALANKLIGQLSPTTTTASLASAAPSTSTDLRIHKLADVPELTVDFAAIEYKFIGADPADLGPALGPQGSPSPGAAGGLLQDLAVLGADAAGKQFQTSTGGSTAPAVVNAFLKIEETLIDQQNDFLKSEDALLKYSKHKLSAAAVDYFLKIDQDLIALDNDAIGPPTTPPAAASTTATGGIAGVLLKLDLPADMLANIQNKMIPAVQDARDAALAALAQLQQGASSGADTIKINIEHIELKVGGGFGVVAADFMKIENALLNLDPTDLGPALGLQGSPAPGMVGGLLQDALALVSDVGVGLPVTFHKHDDDTQLNAAGAEQGLVGLGVQLAVGPGDAASVLDGNNSITGKRALD